MRGVATLLFIEDDPNIRTALRLSLEDEGYRVEEAPDGESGIRLFAQVRPDLVLLDLRLPDMSGFEVCRSLRRLSTVPIIIVTAQTDTHDLVVGLEAGADDYVTKPVNTKELAARIRASIRRNNLAGTGGIGSVSKFGDVELRRDLSVVTTCCASSPTIRTWCCRATSCSSECGDMSTSGTADSWMPTSVDYA